MQENKSDYSKLKVVQTNFYSPNLYGQDVEDFHNGNSRVLMYRYVKLMQLSKYILIACALGVYFIGWLNLGTILSVKYVDFMSSNLVVIDSLQEEIIKAGGGLVELSNIVLILSSVMPLCLAFGMVLLVVEIAFLREFKFSEMIRQVKISSFRIVGIILILLVVVYIAIFFSFNHAGANSTGRMSFLWKPVDGVLGYTVYTWSCFVSIWTLPSIMTSTYALFLKIKNDVRIV
ncbi:hypothetical protein [Vibrio nomapromontoriensis]|uniref:hypothetical protein n=1 Tax=Vibrio nomapromontoriensis TaxID=2910246 RepID=UPI003D0F795F